MSIAGPSAGKVEFLTTHKAFNAFFAGTIHFLILEILRHNLLNLLHVPNVTVDVPGVLAGPEPLYQVYNTRLR